MEGFGRRVLELLAEANYTHREFAEMVGSRRNFSFRLHYI